MADENAPEAPEQESGESTEFVQEERVLGDGAKGDVNDPAARPESEDEHAQMTAATESGSVPVTEPVEPEVAPATAPAQPQFAQITEKSKKKGEQA